MYCRYIYTHSYIPILCVRCMRMHFQPFVSAVYCLKIGHPRLDDPSWTFLNLPCGGKYTKFLDTSWHIQTCLGYMAYIYIYDFYVCIYTYIYIYISISISHLVPKYIPIKYPMKNHHVSLVTLYRCATSPSWILDGRYEVQIENNGNIMLISGSNISNKW